MVLLFSGLRFGIRRSHHRDDAVDRAITMNEVEMIPTTALGVGVRVRHFMPSGRAISTGEEAMVVVCLLAQLSIFTL